MLLLQECLFCKMKTLVKISAFFALLFFASVCFGQEPSQDTLLNRLHFKEYRLVRGSDTIYFYAYQNNNKPKKHLVLYISGSTPQPLFSYEFKDGKPVTYTWSHMENRSLPDNYLYVLIAKPGMRGVWSEAALSRLDGNPPAAWLEKNTLDFRVRQADEVIRYCRRHLLSEAGKTIVYGHSEGFNVVARLLTVNKQITHAGLWCGSAMPDYYDFMVMKRKELYEGKVRDSLAALQLDTMLNNYRDIFKQPGYHKPGSIYTNKRWISYAQGPITDLVKINIPIYQIISTQDANAPYESAFIVPLEFIRLGKHNLTLKTLIGGDHSLNTKLADGSKLNHWNEYFKDFISWTDTAN
jgi:hypothetical protein